MYNVGRITRKGEMLMEQQEEIWKDIVIEKNGVLYDFTGLYQVSNLGRVRSLNYQGTKGNEQIMVTRRKKDGHHIVGLSSKGKCNRFQVHRLVATAFIPNPDNLPVVNHIDENPENNRVENLEWCTVQYNTQYSAKPHTEERKQKMSKMFSYDGNPKAREVICIETGQVFGTLKEASEWCGGNVRNCCRKKSRTAGGYHWEYYDVWLKLQSENN